MPMSTNSFSVAENILAASAMARRSVQELMANAPLGRASSALALIRMSRMVAAEGVPLKS